MFSSSLLIGTNPTIAFCRSTKYW